MLGGSYWAILWLFLHMNFYQDAPFHRADAYRFYVISFNMCSAPGLKYQIRTFSPRGSQLWDYHSIHGMAVRWSFIMAASWSFITRPRRVEERRFHDVSEYVEDKISYYTLEQWLHLNLILWVFLWFSKCFALENILSQMLHLCTVGSIAQCN